MQIGDDEQAFVRPIQRAGTIGDEGGGGDCNFLTSPCKGEDGGRSPPGGGQCAQDLALTASPPSPTPPRSRPRAYRPLRRRPPHARSPASPEPPAARRGRALYGRFGP